MVGFRAEHLFVEHWACLEETGFRCYSSENLEGPKIGVPRRHRPRRLMVVGGNCKGGADERKGERLSERPARQHQRGS